jgi:phosphoribosylanthranilate isomerase
MAIEYGASAIGLVGKMPSGPGVISDDLIAKIAQSIPPPIASFLLTSETKATKIIEHHQKVHTSTIQIVDKLANNAYDEIKLRLPNVKLVQVIHVLDDDSVKEAMEVSKYVDAVLLDSGNPNLEIKELGGTGRTHNWELSREISKRLTIPVFLAGGINAENVRNAIEAVKPFGLDLCSSVRTENKLDREKLSAFFQAIRNS